MSTYEEKVQAAIDSLAGPLDFTDAQVVTQPRKTTVVYSVRLPEDLATRIAAIAEQRGATASDAVRDLLVLGLAALDEDRVITVHTADLRRLVEQFVTGNAA
ncbi:MAG TPA: hypothetical protein VFZ32_05095 [Micromonosporaceae bacterium]